MHMDNVFLLEKKLLWSKSMYFKKGVNRKVACGNKFVYVMNIYVYKCHEVKCDYRYLSVVTCTSIISCMNADISVSIK